MSDILNSYLYYFEDLVEFLRVDNEAVETIASVKGQLRCLTIVSLCSGCTYNIYIIYIFHRSFLLIDTVAMQLYTCVYGASACIDGSQRSRVREYTKACRKYFPIFQESFEDGRNTINVGGDILKNYLHASEIRTGVSPEE